MSMSDYEERFRPLAPSLHQIFSATGGRSQERRRRRRIWVAATVVGVLTVAYTAASPHALHGWRSGHSRTPACQAQRSAMVSDEFRLFL